MKSKKQVVPKYSPHPSGEPAERALKSVVAPIPLARERSSLGERIRQIRREHNWTLQDLSRKTGVGASTLSKLENNQVDVTFDTVMRICHGLDLSLLHLTSHQQESFGRNVRTVTRKTEGLALPTPTYGLEVLCTEIAKKGMIPTLVTVKARRLEEFTRMNQHPGEEFVYVLKGRIALHTKYYGPTILDEGDSTYYDSSMPHAFVSVGDSDAVVLSVSHDNSRLNQSATGHLTDW